MGLLPSDVDECAAGNHSCDQGCTNTVGFYQCYCQLGYFLRGNHRTCSGNYIITCTHLEGHLVSLKRPFSLIPPLPSIPHAQSREVMFICFRVSSCFISLPCPFFLHAFIFTNDFCCVLFSLCQSGNLRNGVSVALNALIPCCLHMLSHVAPSHSIRTADLDECALGLHNCSGGCTNTRGGHRCTCPDGYQVQPFVNSCEGKYGRILIEFIVEFVAEAV